MDRELNIVFQELGNAFLKEGRSGGDEAVNALSAAQSKSVILKDTGSAPKWLIENAAAQPRSLPVALEILGCCSCFHWEKWAEDVLEDEVSANLYTTELIGPEGLIHHNSVRIGLLVSAANTDYPLSSHSGEETYYVISGTAEWIIAGQSYRMIPPGSLVHHPSWVPHGRRTGDEIFLGAWRWSGDLDLNSFQIDGENPDDRESGA